MINKIVYYFVAVFRHRFITEDAIDYATTCVDGSVLALEAGWRAGAGTGAWHMNMQIGRTYQLQQCTG